MTKKEIAELLKKPCFSKMKSKARTWLCDVWNPVLEVWQESDEHLKERIKVAIEEGE